jgi:copper resistance protein B
MRALVFALSSLACAVASAQEHRHEPETPATHDPVPPITDAERAAAFPAVHGHAAHDRTIHSFLQIRRLEAWNADDGTGAAWDASGWTGGDIHRLRFRSEGERISGDTHAADVEVLYGRAVRRWWDVVAGVRHDFGLGPSRTFAGIGVMGVAPYGFEIEATAYLGEGGRTAARFEVEYELLLTNRLILQPLLEADFYGKDDEARGIESGLATLEAGLRLRYEASRRLAPYVGFSYERELAGDDISDSRLVFGLRTWF